MNENKTLVIWLNDGNTLKFEQVEEFYEHDGNIAFNYFGVSTQVKRSARFLYQNIAGYALKINETRL